MATGTAPSRTLPGAKALNPELADFLARQGVQARRALGALALLRSGWRRIDELVECTSLDRRSVTELLVACGEDVRRRSEEYRIAPEREYPVAEPPTTPEAELVSLLRAEIAAAPPPLAALDHVPATPETVAARALWLCQNYWLPGAHVLFLGDHDLTSLAVAALGAGVMVTVLDVDERLLEFVDDRASAHGCDVRCVHADLRFGLPPALAGSADLVFTDPPYTQEGMALFVSRGVACLHDFGTGRVLAAYGYSPRTPALGAKVQQALLTTGVVFEGILPGFNRYAGAHAVGSASDLYICQPTARAVQTSARTGIYSRGPAAVESRPTDPALLDGLRATLPGEPPGPEVRGPGWNAPVRGARVAVDLSRDPGPWLLRTLLACNSNRVSVLVHNNHPDLANAAGQRALSQLVGAKYRLRFYRSTPDDFHAVVVAILRDTDELDAGERTAHELLRRAHGTLGSVWREALITASGRTLSKREARQRIDAAVHAEPRVNAEDLKLRPIDLPRHRLEAVLTSLNH